VSQYGIGERPERDEKQNEAEEDRLLDGAADLLLFTRIEFQNDFDVPADLVALGFGWRAG